MLQNETEQAGIAAISPREEPPRMEPFLGTKLSMPRTRRQAEAAIQQLAAMRRNIERGKPKPVPLEGREPALLSDGPSRLSAGQPAAEISEWTGDQSRGRQATLVIEDAKSWSQLCRELSLDPVPAVDFTRQEVVAVFAGTRPGGGGSVEIVAVETASSAVLVAYRRQGPAAGGPPPRGPSSPYVLRAIDRAGLPVRFKKIP